MEAVVVLIVVLGVLVLLPLLFHQWGAGIAEGKGRSRSLGWWAVFFGIWAIIVLALLRRNRPDPGSQSAHSCTPARASLPVSHPWRGLNSESQHVG